MPSILPLRQKKAIEDEESEPLKSTPVDAESESPPPPSYPPGPPTSAWGSGNRVGGSGTVGRNVTFTFVPRWPVKGKEESLLGKLYDKGHAIAMVQEAFPVLSEYPSYRIEFLAPVTPEAKTSDPTGWSKISDEAWREFEFDPPPRLKVQVVDLPGQAGQRARREIWLPIVILLGAVSPFVLLLIVAAIMSP